MSGLDDVTGGLNEGNTGLTFLSGSSGGSTPTWVRPSDWPAMPTSAAQEVDILAAVWNNGSNYCALSATVSSGTFTVNWGDGTAAQTYTSGSTASYQYSYSASGLGSLTSEGYKTAVIKITPTTGGATITALDTGKRNSLLSGSASNPWLDMQINASSLTTVSISGSVINSEYLQRCNIVAIGAVTSLQSCFRAAPHCNRSPSRPARSPPSPTSSTASMAAPHCNRSPSRPARSPPSPTSSTASITATHCNRSPSRPARSPPSPPSSTASITAPHCNRSPSRPARSPPSPTSRVASIAATHSNRSPSRPARSPPSPTSRVLPKLLRTAIGHLPVRLARRRHQPPVLLPVTATHCNRSPSRPARSPPSPTSRVASIAATHSNRSPSRPARSPPSPTSRVLL